MIPMHLFRDVFEYVHCIQTAEACSDSDLGCAAVRPEDCNSLMPSTSPGITILEPHTFFVWQLCPKTCSACEGQRTLDEAAVARVRSPCQEGWSYADGSCFRQFDSPNLVEITHTGAADLCMQGGADLARVDSAAKNHLVFELLRRRRSRLPYSPMGSASWIGLRLKDGATCNADPHNWHWGDEGRAGHSNYTNWKVNPSYMDPVDLCGGYIRGRGKCALLNHPVEDYSWNAIDCGGKRAVRSYICSKPALVRPAGAGSCSDLGMAPVTSFDACAAAAKALGLDVRRATAVVGPGVPRPEGCSFNLKNLLFNTDTATRRGTVLEYRGGRMTWWQQICVASSGFAGANFAGANSTGANLTGAPDLGSRESRLRASMGAQQQDGWMEEVAVAFCLTGACVLLVVCKGRSFVGAAAAGLRAARCALLCAWCRRASGSDEDALGAKVKVHVAQRRQQAAVVAAGVHLAYRLLRLVLDHVLAGTVCQSSRATRIGIIGMEVGEICLASALLVSRQGTSRRVLIWCWVLLLPASRLGHAALMGGMPFLSTSRLIEDLLWRLVHGAAMDPTHALAVNVLYTGVSALLYRAMIPDGMLDLIDGGGCIELYAREDLNVLLYGTEFAKSLEKMSGAGAGNTLAWSFVETLMQRSTSFERFAMLELLALALVLACIALLSHVMASEMRSVLKLQNTEKLLSAVSEILAKLCDCVVTLDGSLRISQPSPRFAALLNFPASAATGGSLGFCDRLVDHEDEEKVRAAVEAGHEAGHEASHKVTEGETLSVRFKDALGVNVPCQIFHATFTALDGQPRHVLGINEVGEREALPIHPLKKSSIALELERAAASRHAECAEAGGSAPPGQPQGDESLSSMGVSVASSDAESEDGSGVERRFDLQLHACLVTSMDAGAKHLFGVDLVGRRLDDLINDTDEYSDFFGQHIDWLLKVKHRRLPEGAQTLGPYVFSARPYLRGDRLREEALPRERNYRASLEITFPGLPDASEDFDYRTYKVAVRMQGVKRVRAEPPAESPTPSSAQSSGGRRHSSRRRRDGGAPRKGRRGTASSPARAELQGPTESTGWSRQSI